MNKQELTENAFELIGYALATGDSWRYIASSLDITFSELNQLWINTTLELTS